MLDKSINVARRLSARNEPDLLPFDFNNVELITEEKFLNSDDEDKEYTKDYCEAIMTKITTLQNEHQLPRECKRYASVREGLIRRRETDKHDYAIAFKGMNSGQALSAMAARERGHLNPSQVQRRFTNRRAGDRRVW